MTTGPPETHTPPINPLTSELPNSLEHSLTATPRQDSIESNGTQSQGYRNPGAMMHWPPDNHAPRINPLTLQLP